jgi:glycosyltransferase involved in cell wall biosynthesis
MNKYTQGILQELYGIPWDRFVQFPHPHFSELLSDIPVSVPLRESLAQWAQSRPVISYFSNHSTEHSFETFLASLPLLKRLLPDLRILIVSRVQQREVSQAIERKLGEAGFGNECLFRWSHYSYSELLAYLEATSVVVVPYKNATQSGVIPLAYGFGIPVVASSVGGLPEMVVPGKTGELVPPENPAALAEAIAHVVTPGNLQTYREGAREFARTAISPARAAEIVSGCLSSAEKSS